MTTQQRIYFQFTLSLNWKFCSSSTEGHLLSSFHRTKVFACKMQRPGGQGTAFSIDSLIGTPQPRPGHLLYTGYPMFMPYRPLVIPQALSHSPLSSGIPPLAPLASFAGRLTNTFCASLGQGVPSMVALTTTMPSFSDPPDSFYPPQELPGPRLSAADPGARRQESPHSEELHSRDKSSEMLNFSETFQTISGRLNHFYKSFSFIIFKPRGCSVKVTTVRKMR